LAQTAEPPLSQPATEPAKQPAQQPPAEDDSSGLTEGLIDDLLGEEKTTNEQTEPSIVRSSDNPLAAIQQNMVMASSVLMKGQVGKKTMEVQDQILRDLDSLIEQMRQQAQEESQQQKSTQSSTQSSTKTQKQQSNAKLPTSVPEQQPSEQKQVRNGNQPGQAQLESGKTEVNLAENAKLSEGVWGHLPERVRRQMMATGSIKFLPKYQQLIEEYYRRIAQQGNAEQGNAGAMPSPSSPGANPR
jgi:hypothetical protein